MEQLIINSIKSLFAFFFMAEHLNDLLAIHHLFNITVDRGDITLLGDKVLGTGTTYHFGGIEHDSNHKKCDDRQWNV